MSRKISNSEPVTGMPQPTESYRYLPIFMHSLTIITSSEITCIVHFIVCVPYILLCGMVYYPCGSPG